MACVEVNDEVRNESPVAGGLRKRKGVLQSKDAALIQDEVVKAKDAAFIQEEVFDSPKSWCLIQNQDHETDSVSDHQQSPPTAAQPDHHRQSPTTAAAFAAKLRVREGCPVGICLDYFAGVSPRVASLLIQPCAVRKYNEGVAPERRVLPGDFIISIHGRATADMSAETLMSALSEKRELELAIARPFEFLIPSLDIRGGPLGMTLRCKNRGTCMQVKGVSDTGAVATYNASATPERQVKVGNWILAVNETTGSGQRLAEALQHSSEVSLLLSRPSCEKVLEVRQGGCKWTTRGLGMVALIMAVIMIFCMREGFWLVSVSQALG
mmetsp:Transcript_880/g.3546  ORF Transcript_880/g.3546 Transcript_880/m.3546 type:complete len:324 (+) Transcript_880:79-1050(+)